MEKGIFSPDETKVLDILAEKKSQISIAEIADEFFKNDKPLDPSNLISGKISRINKKCRFHKLKWFVNGKGLGRHGRTVWLDKI